MTFKNFAKIKQFLQFSGLFCKFSNVVLRPWGRGRPLLKCPSPRTEILQTPLLIAILLKIHKWKNANS